MNPFDLPEEAERYLEEHSSPEGEVLHGISRYTWLNEVHPQMISGQVQGWFYRMVSLMIRPERILEIGTFTGYSTIALSAGLKEGGRISTIEINEEYREVCLRHFREAGIENKTELIIGDALAVLPGLAGPFDLVLIDARKEEYTDYYRMIIEKVKPGGILLADNVLWGGKVLEEPREASAEAVHAFNRMVTADPRVENVLLPVRDGIMFIRKR